MSATYPSLRGRTVLVTGGGSGIGAALVEAFAEQGSRVVFLDIAEDAGRALVTRLCGTADVQFMPCDVTDTPSLQAAIAAAGEVDVLVNNAGNDTRHQTADVSVEQWDRIVSLNLRHYFFAAQAVLPGMRARRRGSIVNLSSIAWMIPSTGLPVYIAAKAAIVGLTRTLAHEAGPDNVRVNAVLPGAILTERQQRLWMTPEYEAEVLGRQALKRHLMPEEVARTVLFLAADDSSAITNGSLIVDGGWV